MSHFEPSPPQVALVRILQQQLRKTQTQFTDVYTILIQHNRLTVYFHTQTSRYNHVHTQHVHINTVHTHNTAEAHNCAQPWSIIALWQSVAAKPMQCTGRHMHTIHTQINTHALCVHTQTHARNSEICRQNTFYHLHRCTSKDKHLPKCVCSWLAAGSTILEEKVLMGFWLHSTLTPACRLHFPPLPHHSLFPITLKLL